MQENSLVDELRIRQESSWRAGNAIGVADLLKTVEVDQVSAEDILALVESELKLCQRYDQPVDAQSYIEQFPHLEQRIAEIFSRRHDVPPTEQFAQPAATIDTSVAPDSTVEQGDPQYAVEQPPADIPGYELADAIGVGGMGCVYRARDLSLDREVAIKFILPKRADSTDNAARFRAEAKIMGRLQHPGIPAIHELGELPDGRDFLAMKLVQGRTLADLMAADQLDHGKLVAVFEQICNAVGYAHAEGVIHRDLKPANVMVGAFGEVQVMDWGLAKQIGSSAPSDDPIEPKLPPTEFSDGAATATGTVMGTPAYMAPEQARGEVQTLDARCDVFGLGAILCHMLTGRPLYRGDNVADIWRQVVKGDVSEAMAALEDASVESDLRGLCQRCLASDPDSRPENGSQVANEIGRIRQAAEERARIAELERAEAQVRENEQRKRRRVTRIAVGAVIAVLSIGILGTSLAMLEARRQQGIARTQEIAATNSANAEAIARSAALKRLEQVESSNEIITSIFDDINVRYKHDREEPLENLLANQLIKAAEQLEDGAISEPLLMATMQSRLGYTLLSLGYPREAKEILVAAHETRRELLGPADILTLETADSLAESLRDSGDYQASLELARENYAVSKETLGEENLQSLSSMRLIGLTLLLQGQHGEAIQMLEECLAISESVLPEDNLMTAMVRNPLGEAYRQTGQYDKSLANDLECLRFAKKQFGPNHVNTLTTVQNVSTAYHYLGQYQLARYMCEDGLTRARKHLGKEHSVTIGLSISFASALSHLDEHAEAIEIFDLVLPQYEARLGANHPQVILGWNNLSLSCLSVKDYDRARLILDDISQRAKVSLPEEHPLVLVIQVNKADLLNETGELEEAIVILEEVAAVRERTMGRGHFETLLALNNLATSYAAAGDVDRAIELYEELVGLFAKYLPQGHPQILASVGNLARTYWVAKRYDEAIELYTELVERYEKTYGRRHRTTMGAIASLGVNYRDDGQYDKALPLLEEAYESSKQDPSIAWAGNALIEAYSLAGRMEDAFRTANAILERAEAANPTSMDCYLANRRVGFLLLKMGNNDEADSYLDKCLSQSWDGVPQDDPRQPLEMRNIAVQYWKAKRFDKSIPLLEKALESIQTRDGESHPTALQCASNLGVNYKDAGRAAEALPLLERAYQQGAGDIDEDYGPIGPHLLEAYEMLDRQEDAARIAADLMKQDDSTP